ncbi:MAG TPA: hypothetical protein VKD69_06425 [Vicinamibacterales bacterium]|nr:hypothetical protein [Vicinamibacterales bacterium]
MMRLAIAGTVLLAVVSGTAAGPQENKRNVNRATASKTVSAGDDALRARVVDIQQALDRILAETTPAPVGTTGGAAATTTDAQTVGNTVAVDRGRLLQLRRQLDALLGALNK